MRDEDAKYASIAQQVTVAADNNDVATFVVLERKLREHPIPSVSTLQITGIDKVLASRRLRSIKEKAIGSRFEVLLTVWKESFRITKSGAGVRIINIFQHNV